MVLGDETSGEKFNARIDIYLDGEAWGLHVLAHVADHLPKCWLMAMPKFVHRESIGSLDKPRGTRYLW